jgi:hypothetical protein
MHKSILLVTGSVLALSVLLSACAPTASSMEEPATPPLPEAASSGEKVRIRWFVSVIYYNRDLFDAAGLAYPPHEYGQPYADGSEWTIDKMEELAMLLTLNAHGNDATSPDFDPGLAVQWGSIGSGKAEEA